MTAQDAALMPHDSALMPQDSALTRRRTPSTGYDQREDGVGDAVVVVAECVAFVNEVSCDGFYAEGWYAVEVDFDGALAFAGVALDDGGRYRAGVDDGVVEDGRVYFTGVLEDPLDVLGCGEADGFVGLGHEVADVDAGGFRFGEGLRDAADEQVGDQRGVERAGAEGDEVGVGDGFEGLGQGMSGGRVEHQLDDVL